jgi:hypothetical protein
MEKAIDSLKELLKLLEKDIEEQEETCDFDKGYLFGVKVCIKKLENQKKKED